uniref:uncharacterized protein DKFZp434B061-like n=1 Tax=Oncorhynchus gorbuscha TaxID=8017 RepID=UPI001EAF68C4|nr:uncharacterized protein DKFZp434B061-like [Oncorhynchus gorbuscha]
MTDLEASTVGEPPPPYMIFLLVFFFFITGLLGFLVCHLLKKKGYRCRTGEEEDDEECEQKLGPDKNDDEEEENQDTVEQILKCIIENEANMEAFKDMLGKQDICQHHDPRLLRKESLGGIPPHHHTVHSGAQLDHKSCTLCVQGRSKKARRLSRVPRTNKPRTPGERRESTVFAVGRFRVTHMDKKDQGSGDQLDQSEALDSEKGDEEDPQRKEGYNLQSMFKDVKTETTNGVVATAAKRKKSLVLFSLRRGSDPVGVKVSLSQPVVEEEPLFNDPLKTAPVQTSSPVKALSSQPSMGSAAPDDTEMAPVKMSPTRVTFIVSPTEAPEPVSPNTSPAGVSPLTPPVQESPITTPVQVTPMIPEIFPLTPGSPTNLAPSPLNVSPATSPVQAHPTPVQASPTPVQASHTPVQASPTPVQASPTPIQAFHTPVQASHTPTPLQASPTTAPLNLSPALSSRMVSPSPNSLNLSPSLSSRKVSSNTTPLNLSPTPTPMQVSPALSSRKVSSNTTPLNLSPTPTPMQVSPALSSRKVSSNTTPLNLSPTPTPMQVSPALSSRKVSSNTTPLNLSPTPTPMQVSPALSSRKVSPNTTPLNLSPTPTPMQVSPALSSRKLSSNTTPLNLSPTPTPMQVSPALSSRNVSPALSSRKVSPTPLMVSPIAPHSILSNTTTLVKVEQTSPSSSPFTTSAKATMKGPEHKADSLARFKADKVSPTVATVKISPTVDHMKVSATMTPTKVCPSSGSPLENKLEVGSVAIVNASPDSQREVSVVCMADVVKGEKEDPAVAQSPPEEEKEDEVEMEDIKNCRVSQEEEGVSLKEKRRSVHSQHKW